MNKRTLLAFAAAVAAFTLPIAAQEKAPIKIGAVLSTTGPAAYLGEGGTILTSPDGGTWTQRDAKTKYPLYSIAWTGKLLVATGYNPEPGPWENPIFTSPDGITWTPNVLSESYCNSVIWTGTRADSFLEWPISTVYGQLPPVLGR